MVNRSILYFDRPGIENTESVIEIVYQRLKEGDIKSVVVASSTGKTGLKFAKKMAKETNLVIVSSHPGFTSPGVWKFDLAILKDLEAMGCHVVRQSHILSGLERSFTNKFSGASHSEVLAESLRSLFGVGIKVAIECTIMAADSGAIPIEKTIAVGGTTTSKGGGADSALVVWPSHCNNFFDFRVLEILAKPFRRETR
ncbi:MAG: pyruvate kinase alpha/beta domain-containing protein [Thermodesulfobacteriota bacterium]